MSQNHTFFQTQIQSGRLLAPEEQAALADHLANCADCRAYAQGHAQLSQSLASVYPASRHAPAQIRARARQVQAAYEKQRRVNHILQSGLSLAGGGVVLVLFLVVFSLLPQLLSTPTTVAHEPIPAATTTPTAAAAGPAATAAATAPLRAITPTVIVSFALPENPASAYPIRPGTTWIYRKTGYAQAVGDPKKLIHGVSQIEERILDTQSAPPYTILHIQGNKVMLSADEGWQENGAFGLGDYEYWLVMQHNQLYFSAVQPDPSRIKVDNLRLDYQFPLAQGAAWCRTTSTEENPTTDPNAPCPSQRVITTIGSYSSPVGELDACYEIHDIANSGDVITTFCEGIGVAAVKYDHGGSQFGIDQQLIAFIDGKDGASLGAPDPTRSAVQPTQTLLPPAADSIIPSVAMEKETAYLGIGSRLAAIDLRQPEAPQLLALSQELPGPVRKVITLPNGPTPRIAASAGRYLAVLDAATPGELGLITQSKLPGPISALLLDIASNRIYAGGTLNSDKTRGFIVILDPTPPDRLDLLNTLVLDAPVQGLALANDRLYSIHNGSRPKIAVVPLKKGDQFGPPQDLLLSSRPFYSIAIGGDRLYIGLDEHVLTYAFTPPSQTEPAWQIRQVDDIAQPGRVLGLALRQKTIYVAGRMPDGTRFEEAISPAETIQAGSVVDSASYISVGYGQMLVASHWLEIYSIMDPPSLPLLGAFPPTTE